MELKHAIEILKEWVKQSRAFEKDFNLKKIVSGTLGKKRIDALDTVLKVLDMPEEEVVFYGTRSCGKIARRTYEMGLIVGTKREREYWENKIKKKIQQIKIEEKTKSRGQQCTDRCLIKLEYESKENVLLELLKGA